MGCGREGASIWFALGFRKEYNRPEINGRRAWRFPDFIKRKRYKSEYFWHDSFGKYWNRLIGCRLGHKKPQWIEGNSGYDDEVLHCFACERNIK